LTEHQVAQLIIGRAQRAPAPNENRTTSDRTVLRVRGMRLRPELPPVEFELRQGEILGLTGLLGSGAADIVHMVGGARPFEGELEVDGKPARIRDPRDARSLGIGFIPEDRKAVGLCQEQSIAVNVSLPSLDAVSSFGWVNRSRLYAAADGFKASLGIRTPSVRAPVKTLSGGNQQKVMLAKWLATGVRTLAIEEPTHGIDIGGKEQVHDLLRKLVADGGSVLVASTDVHEVMALCDRIGIMRHGALVDIVSRADLSHADLAARGVSDPERLLESLIESVEGEPR
jgi:ABC-type sugar transport system ATPase subunit